MHALVYLMLLAGACLAHYGGYESRNLLEREPQELESDIVECPVCASVGWMSNKETCDIVREGKRYKRCPLGTYINEVCGNRRDCYRGDREQCTEKMLVDIYGQRCAHGYYCNPALGECIGMSHPVDSNVQYIINPIRYPLRARRDV